MVQDRHVMAMGIVIRGCLAAILRATTKGVGDRLVRARETNPAYRLR